MPRLKRLSLKQKNFLTNYVQTGNATEAALASYDVKNRKTAQRTGSAALNHPLVQDELQKALKKKNITFERVLDSFNDMAEREPDKISSDSVLKANIERAKLLKMYPEKVSRVESRNVSINLNNKNFDDLIKLHKQSSLEIEDIIGS